MDGLSLVPLLQNVDAPFRRSAILLESGANDEGSPVHAGIRTDRYKYIEYANGERELYDLRRAPRELVNLAGVRRVDRVERRLRSRLADLRTCVGQSCNATHASR